MPCHAMPCDALPLRAAPASPARLGPSAPVFRCPPSWIRLPAPRRLTALLADAGLEVTDRRGIAFSPLSGLHLSDDLSLNYLISAQHGGS